MRCETCETLPRQNMGSRTGYICHFVQPAAKTNISGLWSS